jgi:hypothetical protein
LVNWHAKSAGDRRSRASSLRTRSARDMPPCRTARRSSPVSTSIPMISTLTCHDHTTSQGREPPSNPAVPPRHIKFLCLHHGSQGFVLWGRFTQPPGGGLLCGTHGTPPGCCTGAVGSASGGAGDSTITSVTGSTGCGVGAAVARSVVRRAMFNKYAPAAAMDSQSR